MNEFERIKETIIKLVINAGHQRLRPHEVEKTVEKELGSSIFTVQAAIKDLGDDRKLVFTYRDPCSYVEIPGATVQPDA